MKKLSLSISFSVTLLLSLGILHGLQSQTDQGAVKSANKIKVLIVDGVNNHDWEVTTDAVRASLETAGIFEVTVSTAPEQRQLNSIRKSRDETLNEGYAAYDKLKREAFAPTKEKLEEEWKSWNPKFSDYDTVVLNYNGRDWNPETKKNFVEYVKNGGGVVLVHAANNAFGGWKEYNDIIGMGWRKSSMGKAIKVDEKTGKEYSDEAAGNSSHGSMHPFQVTVRQQSHPIMKDLPAVWMHGKDELYHDMRGAASNMTILSSAYSDPKFKGTGKHEPVTWEVGYGSGRVIVTTMGHVWQGQDNMDSLYCAGFQTMIARSCEYVATAAVTIEKPAEFPTADKTSILAPSLLKLKSSTVSSEAKEEVKSAAYLSAQKKKSEDPYCMLTPEEEKTTFKLAPGYTIELVASNPDIQEPVLTVWDGNGVMYVAEMRSYMQNVEGKGTKEAKDSRIRRFEDTTGDGVYDKITTYADNINLPRAILPLDDRVAVRETDSMDVICFRDTNNDGVADEKTLLYERGSYGRGAVGVSVEHQDSGLDWNIDNNIYISYNIERYRFTDGTWRAEKHRGHWTQWGLTHNDVGDVFWVTNSGPMAEPYIRPRYWNTTTRLAGKSINGIPVDMGMPHSADFMKVKSLCLLDDRGGAAAEVRGFTSACGQSVFRGNKLSLDDYGRYFVCDPTIHVVRRANMTKKSGLDYLVKTEPGLDEFLLSSDINCRFVNTATGPDGCLYVTDMYRGIIQDAAWLSPGPRKNIVENGLDKNIRHGRIWRIRSTDARPGKVPKMLQEPTHELVRHLENVSGWWRDTAQKLIILRDDRDSVVPLLKGMVHFSNNPMTRFHALWTLEGIGTLTPEFMESVYRDRDPRIRRAAVQISERWLDQKSMIATLGNLADDKDDAVAQQLILTLGLENSDPENADKHIQTAARKHIDNKGVILATCVSLWGKKELPFIKDIFAGKINAGAAALWKSYLANWNKGITFPKDIDKTHKRLVQGGEKLFFASCVTCHGASGKGMKVPGTELLLAPSLVDSPRVNGDPEKLIAIMQHGLIGPLDGKKYQAAYMAPAEALGIKRDDRLAEILSYIRYAWDKGGSPITAEEVKAAKKKFEKRSGPWTQEELEKSSGE